MQSQAQDADLEQGFEALNTLLRQEEHTLALMESCTGGLIAHVITNLPGCGDYFLGSIVSYATRAKVALGVDGRVIESFGAVSGQTAAAMARTAKERFGADYGLGITGVAGPVTQEGMPVGTVYIAVAGNDTQRVQRFDLGDNGLEANKRLSALAAANLLVDTISQMRQGGRPSASNLT